MNRCKFISLKELLCKATISTAAHALDLNLPSSGHQADAMTIV
jgi:hypothetical protein